LTGVINTHANELEGIPTEIDVTAGAVSSEIYSEARLEHVDLIVICSKGEAGLKRWVFGNVAQEVVRHSPVPVLVLQE
jgi:nucleotide-binding universal stress UspA family protein